MRWIGILIVILLIGIGLSRPKEFSDTRELMHTSCTIKVITRVNPKTIINKAFRAMELIDSLASFEGTGDIARINNGETIKPTPQVLENIREGIRIGKLTGGTFDITIRPLMEIWNGFKNKKIPTDEEIRKAIPLVNYKGITVDSVIRFKKQGMKLDLSGIAKGYAVDLAVEELKSAGITCGLVEAGGEIKVFGNKIWKIGIKDPRTPGLKRILELKNQAVATSGDYEQYFIVDGVRYSHILDPRTGFPVRDCASVTIITDNTMLADALATGVFVLGPEKGMRLLDSLHIKGIIITPDLKVIEN